MIQEQSLRVWAEWGSSGVWAIDAPLQTTAGRMICHDALRLPHALAQRLDCWIERLWDAAPGMPTAQAFDWAGFDAQGQQLACDLKAFVCLLVRVEYHSGASTQVMQG